MRLIFIHHKTTLARRKMSTTVLNKQSLHNARFLLVGVGLFAALCAPYSTPLYAADEGRCYGKEGPTTCQYSVDTYTVAQSQLVSQGLRLNSGISNVLFNNYPMLGPLFISNTGNNDFFIPQKTEAEFFSFAQARLNGIVINPAVPPATFSYTAHPLFNCGANIVTPAEIERTVTVPMNQNTGQDADPIVLDGFTKMTDTENPAYLQTTIGQTTTGGLFDFAHINGSAEEFVESQAITFNAKEDTTITPLYGGSDNQQQGLYLPHYTWDMASPSISKKLYQRGPGNTYTEVTSCESAYPCSATPVSWTIGSATCGANLSATPSSSSISVDSTNGGTGNATFLCNGGSFVQEAGATCTLPNCNQTPVRWLWPLTPYPCSTVGIMGVGYTGTAYARMYTTHNSGEACNPSAAPSDTSECVPPNCDTGNLTKISPEVQATCSSILGSSYIGTAYGLTYTQYDVPATGFHGIGYTCLQKVISYDTSGCSKNSGCSTIKTNGRIVAKACCGTADGVLWTNVNPPSGAALCAAGTATAPAQLSTFSWKWKCISSSGSGTATNSCSTQ